jgi:rhodanese-related sulfurtransferase
VDLVANIQTNGMINELISASAKRLVFCCALWERVAIAVQSAQYVTLATVCHIHGSLDAWTKADGPVAH